MNSIGGFSDPRQLKPKHLVVMDHVDDLGGLMDKLGAGHLLDLDLLKLSGLGI